MPPHAAYYRKVVFYMQEIFNMIFIEGDFIKTFCSIFIFSLCCELIFGIVSTIGSFVTSSKG